MKTHHLKIWPEYFEAVVNGQKRAEVRLNDRSFEVGDILSLEEFDPNRNKYTGSYLYVTITHILNLDKFGLKDYVVLSIKKGRV